MDEVDDCIRRKIPWPQLPTAVKRLLADSPQEYERYVFEFSIKNQLRYRGSLVRTIRRDEKKYYEALVHCSIQKLMLFPYHLADMVVKGLRITPFIYYVEVVAQLMEMEKSYDTLPNFTAADCLRLLGIGRNEYLELVAKARGLGRRGRFRALRALLPRAPLPVPMQPWWRVELGYVLEEDVKPLSTEERAVIDLLIDGGSQTAGVLDYDILKTLYSRGLVYLDVPVTAADRASVPPLKGFVMNRIAGDYFETLLYKVFVSIDEHTTVADLAAVLQVDCELVKQSVSLYVRLGFARLLQPPPVHPKHHSWSSALTTHHPQPYRQITPLSLDSNADEETLQMEPVLITDESNNIEKASEQCDSPSGTRRVAFLFDSTLAAYLMMGNLSPDLKSHAVTLFEVGKLCDESLDSLLLELDKVAGDPEIEGEARRYLAAALCLRNAIRTLRPRLRPLDLLRCEALHGLGAHARDRLITSKYRLAISTAPLCREARAGLAVRALPHLGPAPPEAASPWMRLYLYHIAGYGPPTLLLTKGKKSLRTNVFVLEAEARLSACALSPYPLLRRVCGQMCAVVRDRSQLGTVLRFVPRPLLGFSRLLVVWWGAETALEVSSGTTGAGALPAAAALQAANTALQRCPVMIQAVGVRGQPQLKHVLFPPTTNKTSDEHCAWTRHAGLRRLARRLRLQRCCGYVTLADIGVPDIGISSPPEHVQLGLQRRKKEIIGRAVRESISSESGDSVKPSDEFSKAIDDRLRSPIESHFAVTPTVDSKTHSPANGFTSIECSELLLEELGNLAVGETREGKRKGSSSHLDELISLHSGSTSIENLDERLPGSLSDLMSPVDESVSMFSQLSTRLAEVGAGAGVEGDSGVDVAHSASDEDSAQPEDWTILDLQYGVPLFDEGLCHRVCRAVVERLTLPDNLEKLKEDNEYVCADLLKFVSQCQYYPGGDMGIVKRGALVPLPRRCLVFENGRISEWSGK